MGAVVTYAYDGQGHLHKVTDALGHATHLRYDAQGQLAHVANAGGQVRSRHYDALGRLVGLTDARGGVQRRRYDRLGQLVGVAEADGRVRSWAYDGEGNVVRATDGASVVEMAYVGINRLAERRQAGQRVRFGYDLDGQLTELVNEQGESYRFALDGAGRVVREVGFDGLTRQYVRDAAGQVVQVQRPADRQTSYTYDPAGRIVQVQHNEEEPTTYAYDAAGALTEARTGTSTVLFARDLLGQVVSEQQNRHTVSSQYDVRGQRVGLTSSLGAALSVEHDAQGAVRRLVADLGTAGANWQASLERDAEGLELHRQLSGGVGLRWGYDGQGRPTSQQVTTGGGQPARQRRYGWQGADELMEIDDSLNGRTQFGYDALGSLVEARYADGTHELRTPDAVGNLFRTEERTDRRYGQGGQLREANGTRYQYDGEGNLVRKTLAGGQQWHYDWDGGGQLVSVKRPDGYSVTFTYDALGRRLSKRFRGKVTRWVWDGDKPLHEWSEVEVGPGTGGVADVITWLFEADSFAPVAKLTAGGGAHSVVCDHLGTPLELYDGQGALTWQAQLDSYGAVREGKGKAQDCPFRYQGQYEDVETGLYYNRFRYYDPEAGQYISQDPIRLWSGEFNLYAYVIAPTTWVDPLGLAGNCPLTGNDWKFNPEKDIDWRGTDKTHLDAQVYLKINL